MARRASLRASDADREQVAERLRRAAMEGRLMAHELEERLATALRAKTYGELDAVTADLPGARVSHTPPRRASALQRQPTISLVIVAAVTLVTLLLAMLALAGIVAFSGVWVFFAFFWFARGGPRYARRHRRQYPQAPYRNFAGRW